LASDEERTVRASAGDPDLSQLFHGDAAMAKRCCCCTTLGRTASFAMQKKPHFTEFPNSM
jgi:hypothetical protein